MEEQATKRRSSSILKPPRQPLKDCPTNELQDDDKSNIRLPRRVSFANTYKVQEFALSPWLQSSDDTDVKTWPASKHPQHLSPPATENLDQLTAHPVLLTGNVRYVPLTVDRASPLRNCTRDTRKLKKNYPDCSDIELERAVDSYVDDSLAEGSLRCIEVVRCAPLDSASICDEELLDTTFFESPSGQRKTEHFDGDGENMELTQVGNMSISLISDADLSDDVFQMNGGPVTRRPMGHLDFACYPTRTFAEMEMTAMDGTGSDLSRDAEDPTRPEKDGSSRGWSGPETLKRERAAPETTAGGQSKATSVRADDNPECGRADREDVDTRDEDSPDLRCHSSDRRVVVDVWEDDGSNRSKDMASRSMSLLTDSSDHLPEAPAEKPRGDETGVRPEAAPSLEDGPRAEDAPIGDETGDGGDALSVLGRSEVGPTHQRDATVARGPKWAKHSAAKASLSNLQIDQYLAVVSADRSGFLSSASKRAREVLPTVPRNDVEVSTVPAPEATLSTPLRPEAELSIAPVSFLVSVQSTVMSQRPETKLSTASRSEMTLSTDIRPEEMPSTVPRPEVALSTTPKLEATLLAMLKPEMTPSTVLRAKVTLSSAPRAETTLSTTPGLETTLSAAREPEEDDGLLGRRHLDGSIRPSANRTYVNLSSVVIWPDRAITTRTESVVGPQRRRGAKAGPHSRDHEALFCDQSSSHVLPNPVLAAVGLSRRQENCGGLDAESPRTSRSQPRVANVTCPAFSDDGPSGTTLSSAGQETPTSFWRTARDDACVPTEGRVEDPCPSSRVGHDMSEGLADVSMPICPEMWKSPTKSDTFAAAPQSSSSSSSSSATFGAREGPPSLKERLAKLLEVVDTDSHRGQISQEQDPRDDRLGVCIPHDEVLLEGESRGEASTKVATTERPRTGDGRVDVAVVTTVASALGGPRDDVVDLGPAVRLDDEAFRSSLRTIEDRLDGVVCDLAKMKDRAAEAQRSIESGWPAPEEAQEVRTVVKRRTKKAGFIGYHVQEWTKEVIHLALWQSVLHLKFVLGDPVQPTPSDAVPATVPGSEATTGVECRRVTDVQQWSTYQELTCPFARLSHQMMWESFLEKEGPLAKSCATTLDVNTLLPALCSLSLRTRWLYLDVLSTTYCNEVVVDGHEITVTFLDALVYAQFDLSFRMRPGRYPDTERPEVTYKSVVGKLRAEEVLGAIGTVETDRYYFKNVWSSLRKWLKEKSG